MIYDVIVIGSGAMGSSAAYWLAKSNSVLLLDQFTFGHSLGSTHGQSRIIRKSYDQKFYLEMMDASYDLWSDWEDIFQEKMITVTGGLDFGQEGQKNLKLVEETVKTSGIDHEILNNQEIQHRFPAFKTSKEDYGIFQPEAGIVNPDQTLRCLNLHILKHNGKLIGNQKVINLSVNDVVTIKTRENEYKCKKLVIATGSWTKPFLSNLGVQFDLEIWKLNYAFWQPQGNDFSTYKSPMFPIFINWADNINYGFPMNEKEGLVKIAPHSNPLIGKTNEQDEINDINLPLLNSVGDFIKKYLPNILPQPQSIETCYYTMTPDENFIIDFVPENPNIVLVTGFSGHGFKFTPLIGKIVADLIEQGKTDWDLSHFKLDRNS